MKITPKNLIVATMYFFLVVTTASFAAGTHVNMDAMEIKVSADSTINGTRVELTPMSKLMASGATSLTASLSIPKLDPENGKKLFVSKGCVACHSVNGVGGQDAPSLDAHTMNSVMNPFDFAAKMWSSAPAMIAMQEDAFDDQILFSGDELADLAAFVHSDEVQHTFSMKDMTPEAMEVMDHSHDGMSDMMEEHMEGADEEEGYGHDEGDAR